jgi:methionyl aminopeptidase
VVTYKKPAEIDRMRDAGQLVARALRLIRDVISPGVSTLDLDLKIRDFVLGHGGQLLFYRYRGFPANSCISINEEVVHGIPRKRRRLQEGDIVSVDIGVKLRGYCGDCAWTFPVGAVSESSRRLLQVGETALYRGVSCCRVNSRVSDIGRAIQLYVEGQGYHVVKKFVGHGIGTQLHENPQVPNYVDRGLLRQDHVLRPGLVLAIEPMVNEGTDEVETLNDGWTVVTKDRSLSAHFEHTVAITDGGPCILTRLEDEPAE